MGTVLIADGISGNTAFISGAFGDSYNIVAEKTGRSALEYLNGNTPDIVFTSSVLPDMGGTELTGRIKSVPDLAELPVFILAGERDPALELRGLKSGASDVIFRPYDPETVRIRADSRIELNACRSGMKKAEQNRTAVVEKLFDIMSRSFAELVEFRDGTTGGHIMRTTAYMRILTEHMRRDPRYAAVMTDEYVRNLCRAAPLHDIGKIAIDDNVLRKESGLDENEFEYMKTHAVIGGKAFAHIMSELKRSGLEFGRETEFIRIAGEMAMYHHEKWSGSGGYPKGIAGEDIPLPARILSLPDVYDALTSERPYKKAFTHEQSMKIISDGKGSLFDPDITDIFLAAGEEIKACLKCFRAVK
ncbi:MAG: HD domain-containing phosphohydrolase [Oscillospiraceae bacterium]